jgi:hypothetical protein
MEPNDLMKPRYEVIADYPGSPFNIGDIFKTRYGGSCGQVADVYMQFGDDKIIPVDGYPEIFRPLAWWEKRELEDLPKYVKYEDGSVEQVSQWTLGRNNVPVTFTVIGEKGHIMFHPLILPATEAEYYDYITQKNKI